MEIGGRSQPRNVFDHNAAGPQYICEARCFEQEIRTLVESAFAVLAAERLAGCAESQQVNAESIWMPSDNCGGIDSADVVLNQVNRWMIHPIRTTGNGIVVDAGNNSKSLPTQGCCDSARSTEQVYGCTPSRYTASRFHRMNVSTTICYISICVICVGGRPLVGVVGEPPNGLAAIRTGTQVKRPAVSST
jgi:hypothetical protein